MTLHHVFILTNHIGIRLDYHVNIPVLYMKTEADGDNNNPHHSYRLTPVYQIILLVSDSITKCWTALLFYLHVYYDAEKTVNHVPVERWHRVENLFDNSHYSRVYRISFQCKKLLSYCFHEYGNSFVLRTWELGRVWSEAFNSLVISRYLEALFYAEYAVSSEFFIILIITLLEHVLSPIPSITRSHYLRYRFSKRNPNIVFHSSSKCRSIVANLITIAAYRVTPPETRWTRIRVRSLITRQLFLRLVACVSGLATGVFALTDVNTITKSLPRQTNYNHEDTQATLIAGHVRVRTDRGVTIFTNRKMKYIVRNG